MKRDGFALVMAIGMLVVIATIMALAIQLNSHTSKRVIDDYIKNQAQLYAKNGAEFAIYKISKEFNSSKDPCSIRNINTKLDGIYDLNITLSYAFSDHNKTQTCGNDNTNKLNIYIPNLMDANGSREYGYVKIDVFVNTNTSDVTTEAIKIYKSYLEDITPYLK